MEGQQSTIKSYFHFLVTNLLLIDRLVLLAVLLGDEVLEQVFSGLGINFSLGKGEEDGVRDEERRLLGAVGVTCNTHH